MNSVQHLLIEDRYEFERVLDEALRILPHHLEQPSSAGRPDNTAERRLNNEQLRTMALEAAPAIAACAAPEYQRFVELRAQARSPGQAPSSSGHSAPKSRGGRIPGDPDGAADDGRQTGPETGAETGAETGGETGRETGRETSEKTGPETGGAGFAAIAVVLTPLLAGMAAVIFLLVGYLLSLAAPEPQLAGPMRTAGWTFALLATAGLLVAGAVLLTAALRNGTRADRAAAAPADGLPRQVLAAQEEWRSALLERGMVPFLNQALADPGTAEDAPASGAPRSEGRAGPTPDLGYSRPGFSSPADNGRRSGNSRPRYSSPEFTSPDLGGPEHRPK